MSYYLPTIRSDQAGYDSLGELAKVTSKITAARLELDFSRVSFLDANMAAPLGVVLARVADQFNVVEIVNVPPMVERILRKNGFLTQFRFAPLEDDNRTTIPFRRLQRTDEGLFEDYLHRPLRWTETFWVRRLILIRSGPCWR